MKDFAGKRILIIVQNLPVPFDRRVWLEAMTLTKNGYQVSVISPVAKGDKPFDVLEGVSLFRYKAPTQSNGVLGYFFEFAYCWFITFCLTIVVAMRKGFDVIHACNPPDTFFMLGAFYKIFGKKFVFDHHDLAPEIYLAKYRKTSRILYKGLLFLEKCTFSTADMVLTTNESHKEIAQKRGSIKQDRIYIVRSGPDFSRLKIVPADKKLKKGKKYLVTYLGEMCPQDGVDYLLRSIKILTEGLGFYNAHFTLIGGGPAVEQLQKYKEELKLNDVVDFTGRISDEDLCRYLSTSDLCVDPDPLTDWSDKSTMNKILEYMAFGKAIVAFDLKEHRRSADFAAAYAVPNEERDFAEKIKMLLQKPMLRNKMGQFGRNRIEQKLSWDHTQKNLIRAYNTLCASKSKSCTGNKRETMIQKDETVRETVSALI